MGGEWWSPFIPHESPEIESDSLINFDPLVLWGCYFIIISLVPQLLADSANATPPCSWLGGQSSEGDDQ